MTVVGQQSSNLRSIAERLKNHAEQTRSTFTDESRPQFDHRIVDAMIGGIRQLSTHATDLDTELKSSLRVLG